MPWNGLLTTAALLCNSEEDLDFAEVSAFLGQSKWVDIEDVRVPKIAIGLSDFSMEWVVRFRDGDPSVGLNDFPHMSGLCTTENPGDFGRVRHGWQAFSQNPFSNPDDIQIRWNPPGGAVNSDRFVAWPGLQTDFLHVCVNNDRSGFMSIWANGVQDIPSLLDISPDVNLSIPSLGLHPLISETATASDWDELLDDPVSVNNNKFLMVGFALHKRLLTATEIVLNATNKKLGLYDETLARYDMTKIIDHRGIEVTADVSLQERLKSNIALDQKWTVPSPWSDHIFGVKAKDGTIFIEDSSGNDRHYGIVTQETYGHAALTERVRAAFAGPPGAGP